MDDLDRLAFRLVRTVRNSYPHLLAQGFTLTDLEERLVPFREARREMSHNGPEAWEITVLRMVSGERGYLCTDADLQLACRQALRSSSPTVALVRPWSATTVTLGDAAVQLGTERAGSSPTGEFENTALGLEYDGRALRLATPAVVAGLRTHLEELRATPVAALPKCGCRFCGGKLPDTRKLTFCPHCGVNLTVRHCPACSTELDVTWRFCVTCGRSADVPELPESMARIASSAAT